VHETTVRFTDELWASVRRASERDGTSAAQFVRDATVARIAIDQHVGLLRSELDKSLEALDLRVRRIEQALLRHGLR
jgi:hypothetical protein